MHQLESICNKKRIIFRSEQVSWLKMCKQIQKKKKKLKIHIKVFLIYNCMRRQSITREKRFEANFR